MMLYKVNETIRVLLDHFEKDWNLILNVEKNVNHSFHNFVFEHECTA